MNHSNSTTGYRSSRPTLCRYYNTNGYCFYGDQCQFVHARPSSNEGRMGPANNGHVINNGPMMNNGPVGPKGLRSGGFKSNTAGLHDNFVGNMAQLSISTNKMPAGSLGGHLSPLSPSKKAFTSSLAPGGPVSPLHSPSKPPLGSPKAHHNPITSQAFEFLPSTANQNLPQPQIHNQAHVPAPQQMESIGGTTYFYTQQGQQQPAVLFPSYQAYVSEPSHLAHLHSTQTRNNSFSMSTQIRQELIHQHTLSMAQLDPDDNTVPQEVDSYHTLCPIEPLDTPTEQAQRTFGYMTTCYKAANSKDGLIYILRRIHSFRLVNTKSMALVDQWKKVSHSNLVSLREVFTTKSFGDNSLVFVYDYHPGAETLLMRHFSGPDSNLPVNPDGSLVFPSHPRAGGMLNRHRPGHRSPMPERLIWSYIIQLSSALRSVHASGLACRVIDPSKILLIGNSRLRINGCGIFDVLSFDASNSPNAMIPHFQQEDLTSLGKLVLALACYSLQAVQREHIQQSLEYMAMNYSSDLKNLIIYLLGSPIAAHMKSVNDIMPMIGARFYTQLDAAQVKCDVLEGELAKEMENGRLFRILCKIGIINERPEFTMDPSWSETGDRYLLKLFRDYLFHQVTENGAPWVDLAHIVACLNKLEAGTNEKVCLMSRDEQSVLVVSYRDLKQCFEGAFGEIISASLA